MSILSTFYYENGQYDRAEGLRDDLVAIYRKSMGDDAPNTLAARLDRADLDRVRKRYDAAEPAYRAILADCRAKLGPDHNISILAETNLATLYQDRGDWASAVPLLRIAVERARKAPGNGATLGEALAALGKAALESKQWPEAEAACREALTLREAQQPDAWTTFNARSFLGAALLGQKKYNDAEPLLRAGYEGMKQRADTIPPAAKIRLAEALDRLIELAEATNKPDEAKAWKEERAKLAAASAPKAAADTK